MIKILFHVPKYSDTQLSGGEKTAQDYAEYLHSTGSYEVRVLADTTAKSSYNGIDLYNEESDNNITNHLYKWADVIFTHLGKQGKAVNYAKANKKPIMLYMHNTNGSALARSRAEIAVIYNSYFTHSRIAADFASNTSALIRPILKLNTDKVSKGEYITLINLNENKGGLRLRQIAEELPDVKFLAVTGGYGNQFTKQPPNVTVLPPVENMEEVYLKTKLLIMPSAYESYGRTAAEALGYGIPVLYSDNGHTALQEVVGNAGEPVYNINRTSSWVNGIKWISNNIEHYRGRAIEQRAFLLEQIERDKTNFNKLIKKITFGNEI